MYFTYAILCTNTNKVYIGKSNSERAKYDPLTYFLRKNYQDNTQYKVLTASVKEHGKSNHKFTKLKNNIETLEEAESEVFRLLNKMAEKDRVLNDSIVNPERETCEDCGKQYKVVYREAHQTKYCDTVVFASISDLIEEEL